MRQRYTRAPTTPSTTIPAPATTQKPQRTPGKRRWPGSRVTCKMHTARENFARQQDIDAILDMRRVAVVGLSSNPWRPSNSVARYLQSRGYEITPVNPNETEVLG